jgi:glycosyltransferase involved in cell wall biosynthesis
MGGKKKLVFVTRHCCIRCIKEAMALRSLGYEIHVITEQVTQFSDQAFNTITVYMGLDQLYESIRLFSDADIFHCHNEPSFFVTCVKEVFPDKPVVLDVHDSMLLRRKEDEINHLERPEQYRISVDERNNIMLADGLVYPCNPMKYAVEKEYNPKAKSTVLYSYVPISFYRIDFKKWWGGMVYEGRIDIPSKLESEWDFFSYADYTEMAKECLKRNIPFHIYTPRKNSEIREEYGKWSILHEPLAFDRLIKTLGCHDWGLVGNYQPHEEWKNAMPNKLFEYVAGCLPVVAMNAQDCSDYLKETGFGITVDSLDELQERWGEKEEIRNHIIKHRNDYAMERHIHLVEELYQSLV